MERRYRETESQSVREELQNLWQLLIVQIVGTRLRKSARNVFVDNKRIEDIVSMPVGHAMIILKPSTHPVDKVKLLKRSSKKFAIAFVSCGCGTKLSLS